MSCNRNGSLLGSCVGLALTLSLMASPAIAEQPVGVAGPSKPAVSQTGQTGSSKHVKQSTVKPAKSVKTSKATIAKPVKVEKSGKAATKTSSAKAKSATAGAAASESAKVVTKPAKVVDKKASSTTKVSAGAAATKHNQSTVICAGSPAQPTTSSAGQQLGESFTVIEPVNSPELDSTGKGLNDPMFNDSFTTPQAQDDVLVVSFYGALKAAVDNSPDLAAYQARIEQSKWKTESARTGGNPKISAAAKYTHLSPEVSAEFGGAKITTAYEHDYDVSLVLQQAIATFGRLHYAVLAAQLAEKGAQESYRQQLETVLADTAVNYIGCLLATEEVGIAQQLLESRQAALRDAEHLFEAGTVAKFDVLRVRSEATSARQTLIEVHNAEKLAKARLCSSIGLPQGTPFVVSSLNLDNVPHDLAGQIDLSKSIAEAMERRPEIQVLEWAQQTAEANLNLVKSSTNPTLSLESVVNAGRSTSMAPSTTWTTGIVFSVPLYDAGEKKAKSGEIMETIRELEANTEVVKRAIRLDVEKSYLTLSSRWERITQARVGLEQAAEACRVAEVRYAAGLSTSTELLDAQTALAQARQSLAAAAYGYLAANVSWVKAVSGKYPVDIPGWEDDHRVSEDAWYYLPQRNGESAGSKKDGE